jgi:Fe-S-cluster containining protein
VPPAADSPCDGACCAAFRLTHKVSVVRRMAKANRGNELAMIADMVVPLTPKQANERLEQFTGERGVFPWSDRGHHFTCRHWDEGTRLCTVYDRRPMMCRGFPYDRPCQFGCSTKGTTMEVLIGRSRADWVQRALTPAD